jgi:hypothetical protein
MVPPRVDVDVRLEVSLASERRDAAKALGRPLARS